METLIQSSRLFQCSDPRDRLYGITGLVRFDSRLGHGGPDGWRVPEVDYSRTSAQLYLDVMAWRLREGFQNGEMSSPVQVASEFPYRSDFLSLSHDLQAALNHPFQNDGHPLLPSGADYGDPYQKFNVGVRCTAYVSWASPVIKAHLSPHEDQIWWTTEDNLDLKSSNSHLFAATLGLNKVHLNKVPHFEPVESAAENSEAAFNHTSKQHAPELKSLRNFRLCISGSTYNTRPSRGGGAHTLAYLCPACVEKGDCISGDFSIIFRPNYNKHTESIFIGTALCMDPVLRHHASTTDSCSRYIYDSRFLHI